MTARDEGKTRAFASEFGISKLHNSVDALVADPEVAVVYVATPHPLHRQQALAAIAAGKHVLIEKPIAMSADEAREITSAGVAAGVLVMEAMWTRYLPQADVIRRVIGEGIIGDVHLVAAGFGFVSTYDLANCLWAPDLGGGALLDAGIYPISLASSILGTPSRIEVAGDMGSGGVDVQADLLLVNENGRALASTSITSQLPSTAAISGSEGGITIGAPSSAHRSSRSPEGRHGTESKGCSSTATLPGPTVESDSRQPHLPPTWQRAGSNRRRIRTQRSSMS